MPLQTLDACDYDTSTPQGRIKMNEKTVSNVMQWHSRSWQRFLKI